MDGARQNEVQQLSRELRGLNKVVWKVVARGDCVGTEQKSQSYNAGECSRISGSKSSREFWARGGSEGGFRRG